MVVFIDPQVAGISGDMFISSLVNMGASKSKIIDGINALKYIGKFVFDIDFKQINKRGVHSTQLLLNSEDSHYRSGLEIKKIIQTLINKIDLSKKSIVFANNVIDTLIRSESKIHGVTIDQVHLHEASGIDTIVDIIGSAIAMDDLNFFDEEIITAPVSVGSGTLEFSHGITSNPAYAIIEILKNSNISIVGSTIKNELTTPTGASILVSLTNKCMNYYPYMQIRSVGYGAGKRDLAEFANVLKIVHGVKNFDINREAITIIETNVDDITGETLGYAIEKIMSCGAKDITITPALTKKGRITNIIKIMCLPSDSNIILNTLIAETGTLGARIHNEERIAVPRKLIKTTVVIEQQKFEIRYKLSMLDNYFKIEYDDIKFISNKLNKPFIYIEKLIKNIILEKQNDSNI